MTPADPPDPGVPPHDCPAFLAVVHRVLDRDLPPDALRAPPGGDCAECRATATAADRLLAGLAARPAAVAADGLTDRIVSAALRDRRRRARRSGVSALALAASVVAVVYTLTPSVPDSQPGPDVALVRPPEPVPEPRPESVPPPPERMSDRLAEAGTAWAAMTRKVTEQAVAPAQGLLPAADPVGITDAAPMAAFEPAADSLAAMPTAAKAGLEPMASGARRAFKLFLRDTGLAPKPNS